LKVFLGQQYTEKRVLLFYDDCFFIDLMLDVHYILLQYLVENVIRLII